MSISNKEWRQMRIKQKAKDLAFAELDEHDQRVLLSEAEKAINKADREMFCSELDLILADENKESQ